MIKLVCVFKVAEYLYVAKQQTDHIYEYSIDVRNMLTTLTLQCTTLKQSCLTYY